MYIKNLKNGRTQYKWIPFTNLICVHVHFVRASFGCLTHGEVSLSWMAQDVLCPGKSLSPGQARMVDHPCGAFWPMIAWVQCPRDVYNLIVILDPLIPQDVYLVMVYLIIVITLQSPILDYKSIESRKYMILSPIIYYQNLSYLLEVK